MPNSQSSTFVYNRLHAFTRCVSVVSANHWTQKKNVCVAKKLTVVSTIQEFAAENELGNYRPISNLAFIGKLIEHAVLKRLNQHMTTNNLHDKMQSAYKQHHSTETALMRVQHDIVRNLNSGRCVMLVLLDTSAAFDTINIDVLLNTVGSRFNIGGTALDWFRSYLTGRSQCVTVGSSSSITTLIYHGVPQGSVLGPVMFNMYTTSIADICMKNHVLFHRFADDIQLYVSYNPMLSDELENAKQLIIQCIAEIRAWMLLHQLKLNNEKTEFIVLQSPHNLRVYGSPSLELPGLTLTSTDAVRNLGCYFDRHMKLDRLVSSYCSSAYYHLRCQYTCSFSVGLCSWRRVYTGWSRRHRW
ncbi:putative RNA-directed DNA polymerase from transposon BS [Lamellibrachia satsuma]|nr:putative RNA-directed DNA polymerase from transposon BS [Lamellibrachia satsuma]